MPDFVRAYCSLMDGTPWEQLAGLINIDRRWLPGAFRLSGWSHCYGNIMKSIANKVVPWPTILDKMRALVNFFKVHDWRLHAKRMCHLEGITDFDLDVLDTFTASFAHWRYETVPLVQTQLLTIRILCQRHMKQEWFMNVQDRPCLEKALDACKDDFLWTFTAVSKRDICSELELQRHWGMVCNHTGCRDLRHEGKKVVCFGNSRRLKEAAPFVEDERTKFKTRHGTITEAECEHNKEVF